MNAPGPAVLVMAKAPRPGTVKTRLHPLLGSLRCARLQAELVRHTTALTTGENLPTHLAHDPPDAREEMRRLVPPGVRLLPQRAGHLGRRLASAVSSVAGRHDGPLLVVGTDAPTLTAALLAEAGEALAAGDADVVLGPALDGGYYLIGMRDPDPALFAIDAELWSGDQVLAATLAITARRRLRTQLLPPLRDLDTPDDAAALLADPLLPAGVAEALRRMGAR